MSRLILELHDDVVSTLNKLKTLADSEIELEIPEGSVLFENTLNLKLLEKEGSKIGKHLSFTTHDPVGLNMIAALDNVKEDTSGFVSKSLSLEDLKDEHEPTVSKKFSKPKFNFTLAGLFDRFNFRSLKLPHLGRISGKGPIIVVLVIAVLGFVSYNVIWKVPKAEVKIAVNSQPLIKSLAIKVVKDSGSNVQSKILKGYSGSNSLTDTLATPTTGEKLVGEKAKGKVKIYNKTDSPKSFKEGTELIAVDDDDLKYVLDDDVTVPARTDSSPDPLDPGAPIVITPGEVEASIIAKDIGEDYNLEDGETLEVDDYKTSEFIASVIEDIKGGSSKTVKVVSQADLDKLSKDLLVALTEKAKGVVGSTSDTDKRPIPGSETLSVVKEEFDLKVDDEAEEVKLTQTVAVSGLLYSTNDLNKLLDELLGDFVPEGFELSSEERDVKVEILGNSDNTVLSTSEADLQVTLKSFVIPQVDEEKIKTDLAGKSISEAEKILGGIRNVKSYELRVNPNIPLLKRMPKNTENISVEVNRE